MGEQKNPLQGHSVCTGERRAVQLNPFTLLPNNPKVEKDIRSHLTHSSHCTEKMTRPRWVSDMPRATHKLQLSQAQSGIRCDCRSCNNFHSTVLFCPISPHFVNCSAPIPHVSGGDQVSHPPSPSPGASDWSSGWSNDPS